jgi:hypothetical protein
MQIYVLEMVYIQEGVRRNLESVSTTACISPYKNSCSYATHAYQSTTPPDIHAGLSFSRRSQDTYNYTVYITLFLSCTPQVIDPSSVVQYTSIIGASSRETNPRQTMCHYNHNLPSYDRREERGWVY